MMKIKGMGVFLIAVVLVILFYSYNQTPERQARNVVENYLNSKRTGEGYPPIFLKDSDNERFMKLLFRNVFDFNYVSTISKEQKKKIVEIDILFYENKAITNYTEKYKSYEEFLKSREQIYGKENVKYDEKWIVTDKDSKKKSDPKYNYLSVFKYDMGLSYDEFVKHYAYANNYHTEKMKYAIVELQNDFNWEVLLCYDVTTTDHRGSLVFKKYLFLVEEYSTRYVIASAGER